MSNGPISLPHINLHRPQEQQHRQQIDASYQNLPPMQNPPPQNNYYHNQSFSREAQPVTDTQSKLTSPMNTGPTPMFIDSPPPPARTTLPPIEAQFDPNVRRGSITDPSMHATSSAEPYRNSNGSTSKIYQQYATSTASRTHSIRDERPPTPDLSERRSFDSDSQHGGYDRHQSFVSEHHTQPSVSRKSSASNWSRVNGNGPETASLKGFDSRIAHLQLDSTTSLASTSTTASNRPPPASSIHSSRAQQYLQDYDNPPHRRITPHLAPPISTTAPGTFAERYPQSRTYPYPHPNAPQPTPGYPYAFPDPAFETIRESPLSASSGGSQTLHYQRSIPSIHPSHEQSIRDSEMSVLMGPGGSQAPYSRSPELRVSHKLAERKRRREMKDLFDDLRDALPVDKTLKTSKWEILSKSIEFIAGLKQDREVMQYEIDALRRELHQQQR